MKEHTKISRFEWWHNYRSVVWFGIVLVVLVSVSTFLAYFIDDETFDHVLTPIMNVCTFTAAFAGAWLIFRHSEGMRMRRLWGYVLLVWGVGDLGYLICYLLMPMQVMNIGADHITIYELLFGNLLGWLMTLFPTEALRPGWLTKKTVAWQLIPMVLLAGLDYLIPLDLWPVVALYPYALLIIVLTHIREYRKWVENNYSSMEHIDVQWIMRYCIMLFIVGANYMYLNISHSHTRGFTQEWFVVFMLVYSTEQILFRKDPWGDVMVKGDRLSVMEEELNSPQDDLSSVSPKDDKPVNGVAYKHEAEQLNRWMSETKPYLNPEFKLMDLRAVLPMNRTYLSQFVNETCGCSFYQFVNRYRIEEAKRLMREHPDFKMGEVAALSGFSSQVVFSQVFSKETGLSPREWSKRNTK